MKSANLAIITHAAGVPSETFIRKHVNELAPGQTVLITCLPRQSAWTETCPALHVADLPRWHPSRLIPGLAGRLGWELPRGCSSVKAFLKRFGVKIIIGEYLDLAYRYIGVAKQLKIRFYGSTHGYDVSMLLRDPAWARRYRVFNDTEGIIANARHIKEKLVPLGIRPDKISVIYRGVEVPSRPISRPRRDSTIRVLAVGRFVAKKSPLTTLEAFRMASEEVGALHLDCVGDGPLRQEAQRFVQSCGLTDKVTFHGVRPHSEVLEAMKRADIFVQHSLTDPATGDQEGLPVAILEAMAHSLPVVSTMHAGIPEAVTDGTNGFLVSESDAMGTADRLVRLARNPPLRLEMGEAGWERALHDFCWPTQRSKLLELLGLSSSGAATR